MPKGKDPRETLVRKMRTVSGGNAGTSRSGEHGAALMPYQPRRKSVVIATPSSEAGAALITVLLFVVLVFILITAMLSVTGNEIVIAGLQRDGVRALDLAQADIQEAMRRMEQGRPFWPTFTSSLRPGVTVTVNRQFIGTNSGFLEIQATATVGRATRRLSALVLQRMIMFPPNILFAPGVDAEAENILTGDVYSRTWVNYLSPFINPNNTFTYSAWRISLNGGPSQCVSRTQPGCSTGQAIKWYPGTRRTEPANTTLGGDISSQTNKCPAGGGGSLPPDTITGILATAPCDTNAACVAAGYQQTYGAYGHDDDDPDGLGPLLPQAVTAKLPCGLPFKLVSESFLGEDGLTMYTRLFKTVVFEQWFDNYWQFDNAQMTYVKNSNLTTYPQFSAVPPALDSSTVSNFDVQLTGGGSITQGSADFGCKYPELACVPPVDRPVTVLLDGTPDVTNWSISGDLKGHGTMVVNGNLTWAFAGTFTYWGTIIVNGSIENGIGIPPHQIFGGLVSTRPFIVHDATKIYGGGTVTSTPVGRSVVVGKAWWER